MKADLLIRGAELLEADAAKGDGVRFDLGTWASPYEDNLYNTRGFATAEKPPLSCDTKACLLTNDKCQGYSPNYYLDPVTCSCVCKQTLDCPVGVWWSPITCACIDCVVTP